jgi:DNA (cytosine-5)-methyltransferase 1
LICDGGLIRAFGGNNQSGPIDVATAVNASASASASGRMDFESETFIAHALRADGFDASENGTGRGTPLVSVGVDVFNGQITGDVAATLGARGSSQNSSGPTLMAFHNRQDPDVPGDVTHPPGAQDNGMGIAFTQNQRDEVRQMDVAGALAREAVMKQQTYAKVGMQVRRLTPKECCRLHGFPDDYLNIIYRGRPASDGARYKALGNSMAVPVMAWIGRRIQAVSEI